MKNYKPVLTLFIIASLSGFLIYLVHNSTRGIIERNEKRKILALIQEVFSEAVDFEASKIEDNDFVKEKIIAKDEKNQVLGLFYKGYGTNSFGSITLLVAIKDDSVYSVKFIFLDQSYFQIAKENADKVYGEKIPFSEAEEINIISGATYSSGLIKKIVLESINYHKGSLAYDQ